MLRTFSLVAVLLLGATVYAQKATVKKIEVAGEKIIVHYDLEDGNPNNDYLISLFSSQNNFATALAKVSGDAGPDIKPGTGKKIIWNAKEELGPYKGKLSLEVRGKVYTPVARINSIALGDKFKRGKTHNITWKAGNTNPVHVELYKGGERIDGELNQPNNGSFSLFIPTHVKTGSDYKLKITDARNGEDFVFSQPFKVTTKIPLWMKVAPIVVIGGVAAVVAGGGGGGGGGDNGGGSELPEPPTQN
jgi:hypothetical protein